MPPASLDADAEGGRARARNSPPRRNSPPSTAPLLSATLPLDGTDRFLIVQRNRPIVTASDSTLWATIRSSRSSSRVYAAHNISTLLRVVHGLHAFSRKPTKLFFFFFFFRNFKRILIRENMLINRNQNT